MRILVLGHKGMLGREVLRYFSVRTDNEILTINVRWESIQNDNQFESEIRKLQPDFIINCIGKIPQKKPDENEYKLINTDLPLFLDSLNVKVVHPSTDCEFSGDLPAGEFYTKNTVRNATDHYGKSKAEASLWIEKEAKNTKIIRTSIIGHEDNTNVSLLDWFLAQNASVKGYTNHYWNGITTLEWAKQCDYLMNNWLDQPVLTQLGTDKCASKYEVLGVIREVYKKEIEITPFATDTTVNKCLLSDRLLAPLEQQLQELKESI